MKTTFRTLAYIVILALAGFGTVRVGYRNLEDIKANAPAVWSRSGWEITGYEGYEWDPILGAQVWYILKKKDANISYHGFLTKWGEEYHIYNLTSIDAIGPN